jgi:hypothetical protein
MCRGDSLATYPATLNRVGAFRRESSALRSALSSLNPGTLFPLQRLRTPCVAPGFDSWEQSALP